jgi:dolichol-phosphate mannosyltransferase
MSVELSVVLPMYDEQEIAAEAVRRVSEYLDPLGLSYEVICVNDGSRDDTPRIIDEMAKTNPIVVPVHLSRNFGKEGALAVGLETARGNAVILLDADMQHPPRLIPQMVELWCQGYDIVEARKSERGRESLLYRMFAKAFYAVISRSAGSDIRGSSDFKVLDRQVVDTLCSLPEKSRFFRGLVSWVGFETANIEFEVEARAAGKSGWSGVQLLRYAVSNILAFTTLPLYITAWVGLITTLMGVILGLQTLYMYLAGKAVSGFTTVILLVIFFSGITLTGVGTVAVYLAKVLKEVKGRPVFIKRSPATPRPRIVSSRPAENP